MWNTIRRPKRPLTFSFIRTRRPRLPVIKKLLQEVALTNRRHSLFGKNDRLVVGVSGGPDSVALIYLLSKFRRKYGLTLSVAHLNHGFAKKESQRAAAYVKALCEKLALPFYSKRIALRTRARTLRRSLEEAGRLERYVFFEEVARRINAAKIVTAHTLDDQAETVLMRILRGAGLKGLAGIPYKRKQGPFKLIRPLLSCRKEDLLAYLKENRIRYCVDSTNRKTLFYRNRVRHELLPQLERRFNPRIRESLVHLQSICSLAQDYLEAVSQQTLKKCLARRSSGVLSLKVLNLKRLHPALLQEVLRRAIELKKGDLKRLTHAHVAGLAEMLRAGEKGSKQRLPGGVFVRKSGQSLDFTSAPL